MGFLMDFLFGKKKEDRVWEDYCKRIEEQQGSGFYVRSDARAPEFTKPGFVRYVEHRRSLPNVQPRDDGYRADSALAAMAVYLASDIVSPSYAPSHSSCGSSSDSGSSYSSSDSSCSSSSYDSGSSSYDSGSSSSGGGFD